MAVITMSERAKLANIWEDLQSERKWLDHSQASPPPNHPQGPCPQNVLLNIPRPALPLNLPILAVQL